MQKDLNEKTISWTEKIMSNGKNELRFHKNVVCVIIMKGLGNEIMRHYPLQFISKKYVSKFIRKPII